MMETDTSYTEVDLKLEKFVDVREEGEKFHCDLSDKGMVHNIALILLEGLSTACVDNTTGDIFRSPGTVAADIRKEMLEYLNEKSQSFVAESLILKGRPEEEISDLPSDIIADLLEDFTSLKRNLLSRVSGWLLSETREDKIDDFVQEMELNSFWLLDRREAIAQALLKNVDFKDEFHCNMKFKTEAELEHHLLQCGFRTLLCANEGCNATFSAVHAEKHDSTCPFKTLPCEQKCPEILLRRDMDKHCITVCPMKPVNCPFYSIGCKATIPSCNLKQHFLDDVQSHLLYALLYLHKGVSVEDLAPRAEQITQESAGRLAGMPGVRSFTNAVKDLDRKLGPLEIKKKHVYNGDDTGKLESEKHSPEGAMNSVSEECSALNTEYSEASDPVNLLLKTPDSEKRSVEDEKKSDAQKSPAVISTTPDLEGSPAAGEKDLNSGEPPVNDSDKFREPMAEGRTESYFESTLEDKKKSDFQDTAAEETSKFVSEAKEANSSLLEGLKTAASGGSPTKEQTIPSFNHAAVDASKSVLVDSHEREGRKDFEESLADDGKIPHVRDPPRADEPKSSKSAEIPEEQPGA